MPIIWNLKKWLAVEREIYRPSQLQELLSTKAGITLSLQAISGLINGKPQAIRIQTIQALCNALDCKLSDFCDVHPDSTVEQQRKKAVGENPVRLYGGKKGIPAEHQSVFPSPLDFAPQDDSGKT